MKRHAAFQPGLPGADPGDFRLIQESAPDWERIQREEKAQQERREANERNQMQLAGMSGGGATR